MVGFAGWRNVYQSIGSDTNRRDDDNSRYQLEEIDVVDVCFRLEGGRGSRVRVGSVM